MITILLIFSSLYATMTALLWWGWVVSAVRRYGIIRHSREANLADSAPNWPSGHAGKFRSDGPPALQFSVIIPVRNEAENLPHLLHDLAHQTYPHFEVIVADDSSTDNTVALVRQLQQELSYPLHLLPLLDERTGAPKKRAIAASIDLAQGDLILTTDGDCRVGPDWLLSYAECYTEPTRRTAPPRMMTGPVTFTPTGGVFAQLQIVEFASLIGSGAATLALGMPTMCNGANLCYEKRVFREVNGFAGIDHVASGDDELLMHKIAKRYPGGVRFVQDGRAIVRTASNQTWQAFYNQRKRWASKWRAYDSWQPSALAVFVFLSNMAPVLAVLGGMLGWFSWLTVAVILALKCGLEFLFLRAVLRFLQQDRAVWWIPITQLVYPVYVLFFGLAAQKKGFTWKGRKLK